MNKSMACITIFVFCCTLLISILQMTSAAVDTITGNQTIREGDTIVSAAGKFELGFFSPGSSKNRYLGIWYKNIATGTVVWVANRDIPLNDTSGVLKINSQGFLVLLDAINTIIWSSNSSRYTTRNPIVQLLDTGNLVMRDGSDPENLNLVWQSFDYPGDTFLPGMKIGKDLVTGLDKYLSSWKSSDDPSHGDYTNYLDPNGYPEIFVRKGKVVMFRSGPWNGLSFSGLPNLKPNHIYAFEFVFNQEEIYYKYELINSSVVTRMVLNPSGILQRFTWIDRIQDWSLYLAVETDTCDRYELCGAYGSCDINNSPACGCLDGFKPKSAEEWVVADWSDGCVRRTQLNCEKGDDGFLRYSGVKLPDTKHSWFNQSINLEQCQKLCLSNCSCTAYANMDIRRGGSGCFLWFGELIDIRHFNENGQDLYLRMAASELETHSSPNPKGRLKIIVIPVLLTAAVLLGLFLLFHFSRRRKLKRKGLIRLNQDLELPFFDFETIANATNNFSIDNKLGEGGFGPVYKGVLDKGQEIAVKRLSKSSRQGLDEFKNEVLCISKLQHRNLVKFLGYCIQDDERMLIYEYLPNKSMDFFIFDTKQSMLLDWPKRYNIIKGIARGLLYLHQDSRLRIIHRDLKAANILLDNNMNPKISDFGMARIFGGDEMEANTTRVVGTYGYMSPEYASDGFFSVKSDVYSFGVLILEIVSGRKNRGFSHPDHNLNLLGHAWTLYKEGKPLELIDASIVDSCNLSEALRSIHIGLLCVQQSPEDRPNMSSMVQMFGSETALPQPKEPGFYSGKKFSEVDLSSSKSESCSVNQLTVTMLAPR